MSRSAPSTGEIDLSWRMRDREAGQLAELMRNSRLTLLHAELGLGRTELLTGGLLPLLRRRASDAVGDEDRESRVVIPFSDRRTRRAGRPSTRVAERVVFFDGWSAEPLTALRAAVLASLPADASTYARSSRLAPMLGELSRRFDAHFLVILDSFERFWHPALPLDEAEAFVDQLIEAVEANDLRAHFLLSIDDPADPRLDGLRQRIDGFGRSALHLLRWDSRATVAPPAAGTLALPVLRDALAPPLALPAAPLPVAPAALRPSNVAPPTIGQGPAAAPAEKPRRARPPRPPLVRTEPIRTEAVYAFIESTLTQTASDFAPWQDSGEPTAGSPVAGSGASASRQLPGGRWPDDLRNGVGARTDGARGVWSSGTAGSTGSTGRRTEGRTTDSGAAVHPATVESPRRVDRWLGSVSGWMRRQLPKR